MDKMKDSLISVIVPIYNVEKYLPTCLDSLLAQTYPNFELICVNDDSPDGSQAILEQYAQKDSRVRVFRKENGGVSKARNFGLEQARGTYISFVDSDDFVVPQYLERLLEEMERTKAELVVCGFRSVTNPKMEQAQKEPVEKEESIRCTLDTYMYGGTGSCSQCIHVLYRRKLLEQIRFREDLSIGEDTLFFLQAFLRAKWFVYLPEKLYLYRVREDSSYKKAFTMRQYTEVTAWEKIVTLTQLQPEGLRNSAEGGLLSAYARVYYRMHDADCEPKLQKELLKKAKQHRKALQWLPAHNIWEKGRVATMLYCPHLGGLLWERARRLQKRAVK